MSLIHGPYSPTAQEERVVASTGRQEGFEYECLH
jgi:hypothetical protein